MGCQAFGHCTIHFELSVVCGQSIKGYQRVQDPGDIYLCTVQACCSCLQITQAGLEIAEIVNTHATAERHRAP